MNKHLRGFASDNNAGVDPEILNAILSINEGHVVAYGDDPHTTEAKSTLRDIFGGNAEPFFVMTGTAANVLGLSSVLKPYQAVICAETAHINVDECGALERFSGSKLITVDTPDGKLTPELIIPHVKGVGFEHHVQPRVVSVSQPTEMGTVYSPGEIFALSDFAKRHNMLLHIDGARLANAAVSLGLGFKEFTTEAGADLVSFGGTKNGLLFGESVIFLNKNTGIDFKYIRKQGLHLASKMRYIAIQFETYIKNNIWHKNASHANKMAVKLYESVKDLENITITQKVQANGIFAIIPGEIIQPLMDEYFFYVWDEDRNEVRWMTSFDTQPDDIIKFSAVIKKLIHSVS